MICKHILLITHFDKPVFFSHTVNAFKYFFVTATI